MTSPSNPNNSDESPLIAQNGQSNKHPDSSVKDFPYTYDRQIAHAVEIKFISDRYVTPVAIKFGSSD